MNTGSLLAGKRSAGIFAVFAVLVLAYFVFSFSSGSIFSSTFSASGSDSSSVSASPLTGMAAGDELIKEYAGKIYGIHPQFFVANSSLYAIVESNCGLDYCNSIVKYNGGTSWTELASSETIPECNFCGNRAGVFFNGKIYYALENGLVYAYDNGWVMATDNFTTFYDDIVVSMKVYNGRLYAGTHRGKIYRFNGGTSWIYMADLNFSVDAFVEYAGNLYAITRPGYLYRFDGMSWIQVCYKFNFDSFGSIATYKNALYASTQKRNLNRYLSDTNNWNPSGFIDRNYIALKIKNYNEKLYAITTGVGEHAILKRYDDTSPWTDLLKISDETYYNNEYSEYRYDYAIDLIVFNNKLYAGMSSGRVFTFSLPESSTTTTTVNATTTTIKQEPVCGNGVLDEGEECDFGEQNGADGSFCSGPDTGNVGGCRILEPKVDIMHVWFDGVHEEGNYRYTLPGNAFNVQLTADFALINSEENVLVECTISDADGGMQTSSATRVLELGDPNSGVLGQRKSEDGLFYTTETFSIPFTAPEEAGGISITGCRIMTVDNKAGYGFGVPAGDLIENSDLNGNVPLYGDAPVPGALVLAEITANDIYSDDMDPGFLDNLYACDYYQEAEDGFEVTGSCYGDNRYFDSTYENKYCSVYDEGCSDTVLVYRDTDEDVIPDIIDDTAVDVVAVKEDRDISDPDFFDKDKLCREKVGNGSYAVERHLLDEPAKDIVFCAAVESYLVQTGKSSWIYTLGKKSYDIFVRVTKDIIELNVDGNKFTQPNKRKSEAKKINVVISENRKTKEKNLQVVVEHENNRLSVAPWRFVSVVTGYR